MIPLNSTLRFRNQRGFHMWIPLFLVWLLLLPFALLMLPLIFIGCLVFAVNPFRAIAAFWRLVAALKGTNIEVDQPDCYVSISFP